jgi:hypothetical protein
VGSEGTYFVLCIDVGHLRSVLGWNVGLSKILENVHNLLL